MPAVVGMTPRIGDELSSVRFCKGGKGFSAGGEGAVQQDMPHDGPSSSPPQQQVTGASQVPLEAERERAPRPPTLTARIRHVVKSQTKDLRVPLIAPIIGDGGFEMSEKIGIDRLRTC